MKKFTFILLSLFLYCGAFAQNQYVEPQGTVYDSLGNVVPYAWLKIQYFDSNQNIHLLENLVQADINGVYFDSAVMNIGEYIRANVADCFGDTIHGSFQIVTQAQTAYVEDFTICPTQAPCGGTISQSISGNTGVFTAVDNFSPSQGNYTWDINGITLTGNPVTYTFQGPGIYSVCVSASSILCSYTVCDSAVIVNTPPSTFNLTGNVLKSNQPASSGLAILYGIDSSGTGAPMLFGLDTMALDSGSYYFLNLNPGMYRVFTMLDPNDSDFLNFFPTYYGDVVDWNSASDLVLYQNINNADINLVPVPAAGPGPGIITGSVIEGPNKSAQGDPIEDIIVHLRDASGSPLEYIMTDANGDFDFSNIALGDYEVKLEVSGIMSSPYAISLNSGSQSASVSFEVDTLGVRVILGFDKKLDQLTSVFPNPVSKNLTIDLLSTEINNAELIVSDLQGKVVLKSTVETSRTDLDLSKINSGVYFLYINTDSGNIIRKIIKE